MMETVLHTQIRDGCVCVISQTVFKTGDCGTVPEGSNTSGHWEEVRGGYVGLIQSVHFVNDLVTGQSLLFGKT